MYTRKSFYLPVLILLFGQFVFLSAYPQKEPVKYDVELLTPLSVEDSFNLSNLPKLTLPDSYLGPNAPLLPTIIDNSANIHWRPVFAQVNYECGQASGIGLGFTYAINRMRNVAGNIEENQYATHFTWNFGNTGVPYYGVSYFHSFEVVRTLGTPNVTTYGGMSTGGTERWITGYDNYYHSMHNRLTDVYQIDCSTEEGILTAKHWLENHLENSSVGGVANFYCSCPSASITLPSGTPEAGKYVVTSWGGANHGLTISGYHDSICWDYNNDGQYTNDIDLNGDGVITPSDWEIGGFRFANTYSGGPTWANNGFCYMLYKSAADPYGGGGIWNSAIHVIYAKANTEPLLTARVTLKHTCREQIRIRIGVSTDQSSETPEYILGLPVFNFRGGCQYMRGGTELEENKTIEFGLDLTALLNIVGPNTPARYFLLVDEDDPSNWSQGEIVEYSIIDYTQGINEIPSGQSNVTIVNNTLTKVWVDHTVVFDEVEIISELPPATVYEPYSTNLEAAGGTAPYIWDYDLNFTETNYTWSYPMVTEEQLNPGSSYTTKTLDFPFPFYGEEFNAVRVYTDGYIMFEAPLSWVYQVYDFLLFTKNKYIAPFMAELNLYSATNDGVWYEGDANSAIFRWKASIDGMQNTSELNFAVELFPDGNIKYYYGLTNDYPEMEWISGVSSGDNIYYQFTEVNNDASIPQYYVCDLEATHYPEGFTVTREGDFGGLPEEVYDNYEIKFRVRDENGLSNSKVLYFSTDGANYLVIDDYSVISGDDDIIEFGETVFLSVDIKNLGDQLLTGASMTISISDGFITMIDDAEGLGSFQPGEIKTFTNAFSFTVSNLVPNEYDLDFNTLISDISGSDWASHIYLTAYSPILNTNFAFINDGGNNTLDPGETANMVVGLINEGGAVANNINAILLISDPYITINLNSSYLSSLEPLGSGDVTFNITALAGTPIGHVADFTVIMTADLGVADTGAVSIVVGQNPLLILDLDDNNSSALAMEIALDEIGVPYDKYFDFPPEINAYSGIFVCLGIYSSNYVLSSSEGQILADYLNNGGRLYMEGGDTWAYDSQTAVHTMFYIDGVDDGTSDMTHVLGQGSTFTGGMDFNYIGENSWIDHLETLGSAFLILENQDPSYGTGIAYDGGTYKTIGTSHEFGGLADGLAPSTKVYLMTQYLDFFGLLPLNTHTVNLTIFLEGAYNGSMMYTSLNEDELIPVLQPYNVDPWFYDGPENVTSIPNNEIVDWVLVDFRDAPSVASAASSTMVHRQAAFMLNDGSVVGLDGISGIQFQHNFSDQMYAVVWHRNHLGVLSANALSGFGGIYNYDFSSGENQAYTGGGVAHKEITTGVWGMISGDGNCDGQIDLLDLLDIWAIHAGESFYQYGDYNLDGVADNKDKNDLLIPNLGFESQVIE